MNTIGEEDDRFSIICKDNPYCPPKYFVQAESSAVRDVLFIDIDMMLGCPHGKKFGNRYYCTCDDRIKFYIKYGE